MYKHLSILALLIAILFSSCTSKKNIIYLENRAQDSLSNLYEKKTTLSTLQPGDVVYVRVLSVNKEINNLFNIENEGQQSNITSETSLSLKGFTIDPLGYISIPIIDTVYIQGLSIFEAQEKIQKEVDTYLKNASVIVKLLNSKISILGEVNRPGSFIIYKNELTIFEALSMAGDVNQYGNKKSIMIIRTSGEKNETYRVDLTDENIMNSKRLYLLPNDIVIVEPLKLKAFRLNQSTISLILTGITSAVTVLAFFISLNK